MMGAAVVSRASLSRRLSSNNSPADTPAEDQSSRGGTDQDRKSFISAASSSVSSGFSLKPFASKVFSKQQNEQTDMKGLAYPQLEGTQVYDEFNMVHPHVVFRGKAREEQDSSSSISRAGNVKLTSQTSQKRPSGGLNSGSSGFARLHEFADPLPSPASAVASLTRDLESDLNAHALLELREWAVRGQYVVKPQVSLL